jgi:UDP-N-acetylmuramoyl-L-alanyl-D-glutamate--2,6-diaminopimelate ligase
VIAASIRAGITNEAAVDTILDRSEAIARAIHEAGADDVIVVAGKGHERTQTVAGKVIPFDDTTAALEAFATR